MKLNNSELPLKYNLRAMNHSESEAMMSRRKVCKTLPNHLVERIIALNSGSESIVDKRRIEDDDDMFALNPKPENINFAFIFTWSKKICFHKLKF